MKKLMFLLLGLILMSTSVYAQDPTPPGTGVYVMIKDTYQVGTVASGQTHVKLYYANNTPTLVSGVQFRIWYDKNAFGGIAPAPVVTSLNTGFPQDLQFVNNPAEGSMTITLVYTGSSSTFTIPNGELFDVTLTHSANFQSFTSIQPMSITGITPFPNGASDINGMDTALTLHNYGGVFQPQIFNFSGNILTVTGNGAKEIPVVLQSKPKVGPGTWTDLTTSITNIDGVFTFSQAVDITYYDLRLKIQGDALNYGNIVTTADAQKTNNIVLGNVTPVGFDFYSSDVNGSGTITIADVYSIFGRIAGRFSAWPNNVKDVLFFTAAEYASINGSTANQTTTIPGTTNITVDIIDGNPSTITLYVLGRGDANNTGFNMARMTPIEIVNPANAPYHIIDKTIEFDNATQEIELKLPTLNNVEAGNLINVPVEVRSSMDIASLQFGVWYDNTLLEFRGINNSSSVASWATYLNPEDNVVDWGGYSPFGNSNLLKNGNTAFTLQFAALTPTTNWTTSPLWVTRKAAGDYESHDLNIRPTDGLVQILKVNGSGSYELQDNTIIIYPNPTPGITTFTFNLAKGGNTSVVVNDMLGRKLINVVAGDFPKGQYSYSVDLGQLAEGIYCVVLEQDSNKKLIAAKVIKE